MLYRYSGEWIPYGLLREVESFGIREFDLAAPFNRFWVDQPSGRDEIRIGVDEQRVERLPTPCELAAGLPAGDNWTAQSKRTLGRVEAWFLVCEDPQRRLDVSAVATLGHQASLVRHILDNPHLDRVLIADEVGLGKTIEAGLLIRNVLESAPELRVVYLAPARLVRNVHQEFERLGLQFRKWVAGEDRDATLQDSRIVASIHRAATGTNLDAFVDAEPWDVIVVDECHHLSDWEPGGGRPRRNYRLVDELTKRQKPTGRLILMSGTPHQGHRHRFENLLKFLRRESENSDVAAGRVIYRTKKDVRDWDGRPLFPARRVNPPTVFELGDAHCAWLSAIHDLYVPPAPQSDRRGRQRAAGWRCAQALQWATSSLQAGLGYLVRQAIRADWILDDDGLADAIATLRPYRLGDPQESVEFLYKRLRREIERQRSARDLDDIEDEEDETEAWEPDRAHLGRLLRDGTALLGASADHKWDILWDRLLGDVGDEKVVLFAQPIETVTALADYLRRRTGSAPALIIGDQTQRERDRHMEEFQSTSGPQFLVSSRAGGEGVNLQIARRLVHVDVPWNPMELEQRVGRVHRFGSRRTVLVDTLVASESRETYAYRVASEKLKEISSTLAEDRFEESYSRVMSLVPPTELQEILGERPLAPLSDEETRRVSELVRRGFENWRRFHDRFSGEQQRVRALDPGTASWRDIADFARRHLGAEPAEGLVALTFGGKDGEAVESSDSATGLRLQDGRIFACGDFAGMPVTGPDGGSADILGLNHPEIARVLRRIAFPDAPTGAAHLRWPDNHALPRGIQSRPFAIWITAWMTLRWQEEILPVGTRLVGRLLGSDGAERGIETDETGDIVRTLLRCAIRRKAPERTLIDRLKERENTWIRELRTPSEADRKADMRKAVFPLAVAVVA